MAGIPDARPGRAAAAAAAGRGGCDRGRPRARLGPGLLRAGLFAQCRRAGDLARGLRSRRQRRGCGRAHPRGAAAHRARRRCHCRDHARRGVRTMIAAPSPRSLLDAIVALLDQGAGIDRLSCLLTVTALAGLVAISVTGPSPPMLVLMLALSALAGLVETYLAMRVGFDAALFRKLAQ